MRIQPAGGAWSSDVSQLGHLQAHDARRFAEVRLKARAQLEDVRGASLARPSRRSTGIGESNCLVDVRGHGSPVVPTIRGGACGLLLRYSTPLLTHNSARIVDGDPHRAQILLRNHRAV